VRSNAGRVLLAGWAVTVFLGFFGVPFVLLLGDGSQGTAGQVTAWVISAIWLLCLFFVLRTTVRYLRHGVATLVLSEFPLRPGRRVTGGVRLADTAEPQPLACKLRCVVTKSHDEYRSEYG